MNKQVDNIKIEVPQFAHEAAKKAFKDVADQVLAKLNEAKKNLDSVQNEWNALKPLLHQLGILESEAVKVALEPLLPRPELIYDKRWSWAKKAEFVIRIAGRPLPARDIVNTVALKFEPEVSRSLIQNSIPATLSVASKNGKFIKINNGSGSPI